MTHTQTHTYQTSLSSTSSHDSHWHHLSIACMKDPSSALIEPRHDGSFNHAAVQRFPHGSKTCCLSKNSNPSRSPQESHKEPQPTILHPLTQHHLVYLPLNLHKKYRIHHNVHLHYQNPRYRTHSSRRLPSRRPPSHVPYLFSPHLYVQHTRSAPLRCP